MTVEQSAKAVLFSLGVDFPREHDVSGAFVVLSGRKDLPRWFRELAPRISDTIAELARVRGQAGYGFEIGITAEYFRDYAPSAFRMAQKAHKGCSKLLREMFKNKL
jgi:HEPN domain-containing protein